MISRHLGTPIKAAQAGCARMNSPGGELRQSPIQHGNVQLLSALEAHKRARLSCGLSLAQICCNACCGFRRNRQCSLHSIRA